MLDIKVIRDNDCIILSQIYYVEKMLKRFEHFYYTPMSTDSTPHDSKIHLAITYVISKLSRYTHNHGIEHCDAISKLLWFLKDTIHFGLSYCDYPTILKGYCDANGTFDSDERSLLMAMLGDKAIMEFLPRVQ